MQDVPKEVLERILMGIHPTQFNPAVTRSLTPDLMSVPWLTLLRFPMQVQFQVRLAIAALQQCSNKHPLNVFAHHVCRWKSMGLSLIDWFLLHIVSPFLLAFCWLVCCLLLLLGGFGFGFCFSFSRVCQFLVFRFLVCLACWRHAHMPAWTVA